MSSFYPKDVDFMEMFGCESHIDNDGLLESTFIDTQNKKWFFLSVIFRTQYLLIYIKMKH